jgi:hypothetical protein
MLNVTKSYKTIAALKDLLAVINIELLDPQWGESCDEIKNPNDRPRMIAEKIVQIISGQLSMSNSRVH